MPIIIQSKGNQTMKFGQLIGYKKINLFFFKNHAENEAGRLVPDLVLFLKKSLWGKSKWSATKFQHISIVLNLVYNKKKLYKTLDYCSRYMINFDILEKGLEIVSPPHFMYDFARKMFFMLYSINWPNSIGWLSS